MVISVKHCCIKILAVLLALALLVSVVPIAIAEDVQTTIRIVHTNDMHGYCKETGRGQIGFSALKEIIRQENADLVLDIGDTFHGQAFATVECGQSIADMLDEIGYDAMTLGNHDWTYPAAHLKELDQNGNFAILAANVVKENGEAYFDTRIW